MNERINTYEADEAESSTGNSRLLMRSLGGTALALTGFWVGKKLAALSKPTALHLLDRLDILEREGHPQTAGIFASLAKSFDVTVEDHHVAYWRNMLTVTRALDTIIDDSPLAPHEHDVESLLRGEPIDGISTADAEEFQGILSSSSEERRAIIVDYIVGINDVAKKMRSATGPTEMLKLRREEGVLFARMMTIDNPEHKPATEAFNDWFIEFGKAGFELDSFSDLSKDFKEGVTAVPPTPSNYFAVGKQALHDSYGVLSQLPPHAVAGLVVAGTKKSIRKRLKIPAPQ